MAKFKVKSGAHDDGKGRIYHRGEIVESPHDLTKAFRNSFERVPDNTPATKNTALARVTVPNDAPPETVYPVENEPTLEDDSASDTGEVTPTGMDVTGVFPAAKDQDFKVFKREGKYFVYDADDLTKPFNETGVKKAGVAAVITAALKQ